jgi:phosphate-selective porin
LQDFVITLKPHKCCSVDFGQYKVPFGMEGLESSAKLDFVERSALATQFKWADYRDIGFTVKGDFKLGNVKIQPAVGLFNGEGQNKLDVNEPMDFVGRLVVKPIEALHLGVAHYNGKTGGFETDNFRTGGEIKFVKEPISVYGEYVTGKSGGKEKQTYYLSAGYKISNSFQLVARYDWYDPDTGKQDDEKHEDTIGLNYFIEKHNAKIQLNYVYRGEKGTKIDDDVIRVNVQISY